MAGLRRHISRRGKSSACLQAVIGLATALRRLCAKAEINLPVADVRSGPQGQAVVNAGRSTTSEPDRH